MEISKFLMFFVKLAPIVAKVLFAKGFQSPYDDLKGLARPSNQTFYKGLKLRDRGP
jgi:hypothetical protein